MMHHKIFLVPFLADYSMAAGNRAWREEHAPIWLRAPGLRGYVQNRPVPQWWDRLPAIACAEDWFDTREAERALHQSDYYRDTVVPDEQRMFRREGAWVSTVTDVEVLSEGPPQAFRVLSLGAPRPSPESVRGVGRVELLHVRHIPPLCAHPHVLSVWLSEYERADRLARTLGGLAFVATAEPLLAPPVAPWAVEGARRPDGGRLAAAEGLG
jgi:hypothetical protein